MARDGPWRTENWVRGEYWSARQILALFIKLDLGMKVFEQDIHVKKLCRGEWLWGYDWRIARGTGFHWPKLDIDGWSKQDKLEVVRAYKRKHVRAVRFRY
ncbi:MAG: hypothetical protein M1813_005271 [Trichoglossum hirsutum]|nr:MAG: hypothetical protein M1813_005271 [Trichoglossum hirsutum]